MNSKILGYGLNGLKYLIVIFGSILFAIIMTSETNEELNGPISNALSLSIYVIYGCGLAILGFGVKHLVTNFKKNIPILIGIAAFTIIMFICYSMGEGVEMYVETGAEIEVISANVSKWSGAGLYMFYVLLVIAILVALFSEVKKLIR
jgi:hypothetical protein